MSSKRKGSAAKSKPKSKARKVEYDEEDISSEHESEVEDEHQDPVDPEEAAEEELADIGSIPELPAPEVGPRPATFHSSASHARCFRRGPGVF